MKQAVMKITCNQFDLTKSQISVDVDTAFDSVPREEEQWNHFEY